MASLHQVRLNSMCRICTTVVPDHIRTFSKHTIEDIIKVLYKDKEISDFSCDDDNSHSKKICCTCHSKFIRLKNNYDAYKVKLRKKSLFENDHPFQSKATIPETIDIKFVCTEDNSCPVCVLQGPPIKMDMEYEESPSKKIKIDDEPKMSPRDKFDPKKAKRNQKPTVGNLSMKFGLEKGFIDSEGKVKHKDQETTKIYIDKNNFHINDCVDKPQAEIFACQICRRFPKNPVCATKVCGHIFCKGCFQNFKKNVNTSQCPLPECKKPVSLNDISPLEGILKNLHQSIRIYCQNTDPSWVFLSIMIMFYTVK